MCDSPYSVFFQDLKIIGSLGANYLCSLSLGLQFYKWSDEAMLVKTWLSNNLYAPTLTDTGNFGLNQAS